MKSKNEVFNLLTAIFVTCLIVSNVMASKQFEVCGIVLTSGAILFPVVYIVNDVLAEIYGFKRVRKIIYLGFALNAFAVIAYNIAIILPAPAYALDSAAAFKATLSNTWRVLLASFAAYLAGSLSNAYIMEKMKSNKRGGLMARCVISTIVGESLDGIFFVLIAFLGVLPTSVLFTMIAAQVVFKTSLEVLCYPATRKVVRKIEGIAG